MKRLAELVLFVAVAGTSSLLPLSGQAAFPAENGRIAFLYSMSPSGSSDIYTIRPSGSGLKQVTDLGPSGQTANYESWSPDGSQLVYERYGISASPPLGLWVVNSDGTGQHKLLNDPKYVDQTPSFNPRGGQVIFSRCSFKSPYACELYRVNLNGEGLTRLTHSEDESEDAFPVYSPDGTRVAFESILRGGFLSRVYVMNADGTDIHPITPAELGGDEPYWAPDGSRIVFQTYNTFLGDFSQNEEIWSIDPDGNDLKQLTKINDSLKRVYFAAPHDFAPSWSPAGDAIVFERDNGPFTKRSIRILNARTGTLVTTLTFAARTPAPARVFRSLAGRIRAGAYPRWGPAR